MNTSAFSTRLRAAAIRLWQTNDEIENRRRFFDPVKMAIAFRF
jgi:hypothetical protein